MKLSNPIQPQVLRQRLWQTKSREAVTIGLATFLFVAAALAAAVAVPAQTAQSEKNPQGGIRIVLAGDSIVNRRLSVFDDPASTGLYQAVHQGDAAFTNFETLITNYAYPGAAESGGAYQNSPPWVADELKWAGFNLLSVANNHAFDFGEGGMLSTLRALDAAGLAHAGTGENLALARDPAYLDTKKGRVALIAMASTLTEGSLAGEQRPDLIGRPGVNPLRFTTTYTVDQESFDALQKVSSSIGGFGGGGGEGGGEEGGASAAPPSGADASGADGLAAGGRGGAGRGGAGRGSRTRLRIGTLTFEVGDTPGVHTTPNKSDLDGLVASVRNAHRQAGWVIVSSHTHESGHGGQSIPPDFLITAAHAAIDAGADVFVAHGPHILRGIEIYKGKPIFYSLGNFIFENETMQFQPAESFDSLNLPWNATAADYFDARSRNDTRGFPVEKAIWESVIAQVSFNADHSLGSITLIPISLGFQESRSERGRPRLASGDQAKQLIDTVAKLSAPFGTNVVFSAGRGTVVGDAKQK